MVHPHPPHRSTFNVSAFILLLSFVSSLTLSFFACNKPEPVNAFVILQQLPVVHRKWTTAYSATCGSRTIVGLERQKWQQRRHHQNHRLHDRQRPFVLVELSAVPRGGDSASNADDAHYDDDDDDGRSTSCDTIIIPSSIVEQAKVQLNWEKIQSTNNRPILNLSMRDASPEEQPPSQQSLSTSYEWESGQRWKETIAGLRSDDLNCSITDEIGFLRHCPQLYRLGTSDILETARWLKQEFGEGYLSSSSSPSTTDEPTTTTMDPRILSYKVDDLQYGLEFIGVMMMMPDSPDVVKSMFMKSPDLFIEAVEGGIQERAVSSALGNAGKATYSASQSFASDAMSSLRQLKETRRNKK